jgi:2-polyprenyl-6-methoxyphenol hydroxylase-like FAD-dependent oxidoreductase
LPTLSADIIVAGAGVAGATTAAVLGRKGWRVLLLDAHSTCPPVFKAEKILHHELSLLREFGLLEPLLPRSGGISELCDAYDGRIFRRNRVEQIGITYPDLVNALRTHLPPQVETKVGRVNRITHNNDAGTTRVDLADGEALTARLVVVACGIGGALLPSLGLRRRVIQKEQCVTLGFDVAAANSRPFPFESVTYFPTDPTTRIDYLTLFKVRDTMRANLFTFLPGNDPWIREFLHQPRPLLDRALPKLTRVTGDYQVTGKVESGRVDLYRMEGDMPDGIVLVGDALQSSCPSTGLGLKKAFTDISVLAECVPAWFSTPGMSADKLKTFYDHSRKRSMDAYALQDAHHRRHLASDLSPRWRLRRALLHLRWSLPLPKWIVTAARRVSQPPNFTHTRVNE